MMAIDGVRVVSYSTSIDTVIVFVTIFTISDVHFYDPEIDQFKVIQGQRSRCQSKAH